MDCIDCCISLLKQDIPVDYFNFITITLASIAVVAFGLIGYFLNIAHSTLTPFFEITETTEHADGKPNSTKSSIINSEDLLSFGRCLSIIISGLLLVIIAVVVGLILMVKV